MHVLTVPVGTTKDKLESLQHFIDSNNLFCTTSDNEYRFFGDISRHQAGFDFITSVLIPGAELEERAASRPAPQPHGPDVDGPAGPPTVALAGATALQPIQGRVPVTARHDSDLTWYQFTEYVRGDTRVSVRSLDVLDSVVNFTIQGEGKNAVYSWTVVRTKYVELRTRYRGESARMELNQVRFNFTTKRWEQDETISVEVEAVDLLKTTKVMSPEDYWRQRAQAGLQIDWSDPKFVWMLTTAMRLANNEG